MNIDTILEILESSIKDTKQGEILIKNYGYLVKIGSIKPEDCLEFINNCRRYKDTIFPVLQKLTGYSKPVIALSYDPEDDEANIFVRH